MHDTKRFEILDGVRGVAAILVMFHHYFQFTGFNLLGNANASVDLFFILSGFVITHSYGKRLADGMPVTSYISKRVARLYPMFIFALIAGSLALLVSVQDGYANYTPKDVMLCFFTNATFLPFLNSDFVITGHHTSDAAVFPGDEALWSLSFEMLASLAFLGLYRRSTFTLSAISICSLLATILMGIAVFGSFSSGWGTANVIGGVPRVFYGFCLGMVIYRIRPFVEGQYLYLFEKRQCKSMLMYAVMLVCLACPLFIKGYYYIALIAIFAPILILAGSLTVPENNASSRIANCLGWLSYPLYCLHIPVFRALYVLNERYGHFGDILLLLTAALLSVVLSIVVTKLYDEPVRRLLNGSQRFVGRVTAAKA